MQALLLAAGVSSRFFPYNKKHKCLVKIAGEPIIVHTIKAIKRAGITDIILAVSNDTDFQEVLGNGKKYGVKIRYVVYPDAGGAGETILAASHLLTSDFFLAHGNRVEFDVLKADLDKSRNTNKDVVLLAKEYEDNKNYGVLKIEKDKVVGVVEKPKSTKGLSNLRVLGIYFLNSDFIKVLKKEKKHHYSLESAIDTFAKAGNVKYAVTAQDITTLKYPWDLLNVKNYILNRLTRNISKKARIDPTSTISGNVVIELGATVSDHATIKGPAYVGKNVFVGSYSLVRDGSDLEEGAVVGGYMEVKNALIMAGAKTHSGHFEDSILGENSRLGALFVSANVKLDRKNVESVVKAQKIDSGLRSLGVIVGSNTKLGVRVSAMPGVIIGNNSVIGPATTVMKNVDSDTTYYTAFKENMQKKVKQS